MSVGMTHTQCSVDDTRDIDSITQNEFMEYNRQKGTSGRQ